MTDASHLRPYVMEEWPKSDGRTFLGHAFAFYCLLESGLDASEIEAAFQQAVDPVRKAREAVEVHAAATLLGLAFQRGRVETYSRPFGGGQPRLLPQSVWELDNFTNRFRTCSINPAQPFDHELPATHWVFVDTQQFDDMIGILAAPGSPSPKGGEPTAPFNRSVGDTQPDRDRLIRKTEVLGMVPFSRSTLDDRVRRGLFPASRDVGGGIVAWWESEVMRWLAAHGKPNTGDRT